jgi:hypothetical protein
MEHHLTTNLNTELGFAVAYLPDESVIIHSICYCGSGYC